MGNCISRKAVNTPQGGGTLVQTPKQPDKPLEITPERKHAALLPESLKLITTPRTQEKIEPTGPTEKACFGAGCYWGTEKYFRYNFTKKFPHVGQIVNGAVGFMGPPNAKPNPSYQEVCNGETGHVEVYHFEYTGGADCYEELVKYFFQFHDPTTRDRQGNDRGTQYASVIYCYSDEQMDIANRVKNDLQALLNSRKLGSVFQTSMVATDIRRATVFYPAHDEHQDYLAINPNGYCNHRIRFSEWPAMPSKSSANATSATSLLDAKDNM
jgi:peptide-methionine (S)-S-oxide reductase